MAHYEKHYHNDWAKSKSRELVKNSIKNSLLMFTKPDKIKVLCFPGIDLAEIYEVYDSLRIPRENITGIEIDKKISREIARRNSGINLVNSSLEEYLGNHNSLDFDVVSLDYINPIGQSHIDWLQKICSGQEKNNFVLHHTNLIKRDASSIGVYAKAFLNRVENEADILTNIKPGVAGEMFVAHARKFNEFWNHHKGEEPDKPLKLAAYPVAVRSCYLGADHESFTKVLKFVAGKEYQPLLNKIEEESEKNFGTRLKIDSKDPFNAFLGIPGGTKYLEGFIYFFIAERFKRYGISARSSLSVATALFDCAKGKKFFLEKDIVNYSYISESGAPMMGTVRFLSYPRHVAEKAQDLAYTLGYPNDFNIRNTGNFINCVNEFRSASRRFHSTELITKLMKEEDNIIFLGSSAKPILNKEKFLEELKQGSDLEMIQSKYRGWANKPLAQWKAHLTMGTYNTFQAQGSEDTGEKITKEEALNLISSQIPLEEIVQAYPNSFTLGQLRALKAHLTMGTYKRIEIKPSI